MRVDAKFAKNAVIQNVKLPTIWLYERKNNIP